jgi:hypothetical protein
MFVNVYIIFIVLYSSIDPIKVTSKSDEYGTSHKPNPIQNIHMHICCVSVHIHIYGSFLIFLYDHFLWQCVPSKQSSFSGGNEPVLRIGTAAKLSHAF